LESRLSGARMSAYPQVSETPLPFWSSDNAITYSRLQEVCKRKYRRRGSYLIDRLRNDLLAYYRASDKSEATQILLRINEDSLELSCYSSAWISFSETVFAELLTPMQRDIHHLQQVFDSTLRRVHGTTN
jgi:hypothetical protein